MAGSSFFQQINSLLYRNLLLKRKNFRQLLEEIFIPIIVAASFSAFSFKLTQNESLEKRVAFPEYRFKDPRFLPSPLSLLLSPSNPTTLFLASFLRHRLPFSSVEVKPNASSMEEAFDADPDAFYGGVAFQFEAGEPKYRVKYEIRLPYERAPKHSSFSSSRHCHDASGLHRGCIAHSYLLSGFAFLQATVDEGLLRLWDSNSSSLPSAAEWLVQMLPREIASRSYQSHHDVKDYVKAFSFPIFLPFVFYSLITSLTIGLVAEKEKGLKKSLRLMGMSESAYWIAWFIVYLIVCVVVVGVVVAVFRIGSLLKPHSSYLLFFLLLLLFSLSCVTFSFLVSSFFKETKSAGITAAAFLVLFPFVYLAVKYRSLKEKNGGAIQFWLSGLLSPVAFSQLLETAFDLDLSSDGLVFSQVTASSWLAVNRGSVEQMTLLDWMLLITVDIFLYALLALYVEQVLPQFLGGVGLDPVFFLRKEYWRPSKNDDDDDDDDGDSLESSPEVEDPTPEVGRRRCLRLRSLTKRFDDACGRCHCACVQRCTQPSTTALEDLSLDAYRGEITCLLGHNGSGKTTLVNLLVGALAPSSGVARVYGRPTAPGTADVRILQRRTGICPQEDVLYERLSCREHLAVTGKFRGAFSSSSSADSLLRDVLLFDRRDVEARNLSGGEKRKLCVALALIGNPKFLILDEPTAGMDPLSRRAIWRLLRREKTDKLVILTTHFMDEADILSDRKAIIAAGKLKCYGSSLFLKNRFGIGYHLRLLLHSDASSQQREAIEAAVTGGVADAALETERDGELSFLLPSRASSSFAPLLSSIDAKKETLGIRSYALNMTSLEEVFFKMGFDSEAENSGPNPPEAESPDLRVPDSSAPQSSAPEPEASAPELRATASSKAEKRETEDEIGSSKIYTKSPIWRALLPLAGFNLLRLRLLAAKKSAFLFVVVFPALKTVLGCKLVTWIPSSTRYVPQVDLRLSHVYIGDEIFYDGPPDFGDLLGGFESVSVTPTNFSDDESFKAQLFSHQIVAGIQISAPPSTLKLFYGGSDTFAIDDAAVFPSIINFLTNAVACARAATRIGEVKFAGDWIFDCDSDLVDIQVRNHSFPKRYYVDFAAYFAIFFLVTPMLIVAPTAAAVDVVKDRYFRTRSQFRSMGVSSGIYWFSTVTWDALCATIVIGAALISVKAFAVPVFSEAGRFAVVSAFFLLYTPMLIVLGYNLAFLFQNPETCQRRLPNILLLISLAPYFASSPLADKFSISLDVLHRLLCLLLPPYNLYGGLHFLYLAKSKKDVDSQSILTYALDPNVFFALSSTTVWLFLLCASLPVLESLDRRGCWRWSPSSRRPCRRRKGGAGKDVAGRDDVEELGKDPDDDEDVKKEKERVDEMLDKKRRENLPPLVLSRVGKSYSTFASSEFWAVRDLSFAVEEDEIFGLLGPNGAGKSTTMDIVTGETSATTGLVFVDGRSSSSSIAFCPQFNPLYDDLTVEGHLQVFALLARVDPKLIESVVGKTLDRLRIKEHAFKRVSAISGGTKRKLSFALAMLTDSRLALLDEPSTGMDPVSKRFLWNFITTELRPPNASAAAAAPRRRRAAVLTTHSMEEAEALCTRIGIVVRGRLRCLGSAERLKQTHGDALWLEVKLKGEKEEEEKEPEMAYATALADLSNRLFRSDSTRDDETGVAASDHTTFPPGVVVKEFFDGRVTLKISKATAPSMAASFAALEDAKAAGVVVDYAFSEATLEQVFLDMAKEQEVEEAGV